MDKSIWILLACPIILVVLLAIYMADCETEEPVYSYCVFATVIAAPEQNIVFETYEQTFRDANLSFSSNKFAKRTALTDILRACDQAKSRLEVLHPIVEGLYIFEIYSDKGVCYQKVWR